MIGYLKKYHPSFHLIVLIFFWLSIFLFYMSFLAFFFPAMTGLKLSALNSNNLSNPAVINTLEITQILYTIIVFMLPALVYALLAGTRPFKYLGFKQPQRVYNILLAMLIIFCSFPLIGLLGDWNQHIHFGPQVDQVLRQMQQKAQDMTNAFLQMNSFGSLLLNLFMIALIPAIAEEMFFRGALQNILIRMTHRKWIGILLAAIIFSALHNEFYGFFPRLVLGLILGAIYVISGNLWLSIAAHFFNNGIEVLMIYLHQHHYIQYNIDTQTPTPVTAGLISAFIVLVLFYIFSKTTGKRNFIYSNTDNHIN